MELKLPDWASSRLLCTGCQKVFPIDFETSLLLLLLIPEKDLELLEEDEWDNYYIETNACPLCEENENKKKQMQKVSVKKLPKTF